MADFPAPPHEIGDTHQIGDKIWTWDGEKWFADYDAIVPVFQGKAADGMVDVDPGTDFELGLDADILNELYVPNVDVIGNITIVASNDNPVTGDTVTYTYTRDGNVDDHSFLDLTCDVPGAVVTGNTVDYVQDGTGTITMRVESPTATDSPVTETLAVSVTTFTADIGGSGSGFETLEQEEAFPITNDTTVYTFDTSTINVPVTYSVRFVETADSMGVTDGVNGYTLDDSDVENGNVAVTFHFYWETPPGTLRNPIIKGNIEVTISDARTIDPADKLADVVLTSEEIRSRYPIEMLASSNIGSADDVPADTDFTMGWAAIVAADVIPDLARTRASLMTATNKNTGEVIDALSMTPPAEDNWAGRQFTLNLPAGEYRLESKFEFQMNYAFDVWREANFYVDKTVS